MGIVSLLCPLTLLITIVTVWWLTQNIKKALLLIAVTMVASDLILGFITGSLHSIISFIPHINPIWEGAWTFEQLLIIVGGSTLSIVIAKILRFTVPIYFAIEQQDNSYKIIDILRADIRTDRTTTNTYEGGHITDTKIDETKTATFNKGVVEFWCEGYRNKGCDIYTTKLLEYDLDNYKVGQTLEMVSGFKRVGTHPI